MGLLFGYCGARREEGEGEAAGKDFESRVLRGEQQNRIDSIGYSASREAEKRVFLGRLTVFWVKTCVFSGTMTLFCFSFERGALFCGGNRMDHKLWGWGFKKCGSWRAASFMFCGMKRVDVRTGGWGGALKR